MAECSNCGAPTPLLYSGTPICLDCESKREDADPDQRARTEAAADETRISEESQSRGAG